MEWHKQLARDGFAIVPAVLTVNEVEQVVRLLESDTTEHSGRRKGGARDVLDLVPDLHAISHHPPILQIANETLGQQAFVVRATLFDKTPDANWKVPWHQDLTIAVDVRQELAGYGPWSLKAGVHHVQPPTEVLQRIITIRIHLDPSPATNGALRVMPGSHRLGRVNQNRIERYIDDSLTVTCAARAGDALVMRPLLFHASSASSEPGHRRVLHFDYAVGELAGVLQWHMRKQQVAEA